jgi:hypothetical protein
MARLCKKAINPFYIPSIATIFITSQLILDFSNSTVDESHHKITATTNLHSRKKHSIVNYNNHYQIVKYVSLLSSRWTNIGIPQEMTEASIPPKVNHQKNTHNLAVMRTTSNLDIKLANPFYHNKAVLLWVAQAHNIHLNPNKLERNLKEIFISSRFVWDPDQKNLLERWSVCAARWSAK